MADCEGKMIEILRRHTEWSFESIEILFSTFDENLFDSIINGFPIWRQFYHLLNSIERIFTDPEEYAYPPFHLEGMNELEKTCDGKLSKSELYSYFKGIRMKALEYLDSVDCALLMRKSNHKKISMTKLDHILAQLRHMAWHFGYLSACAKTEFGRAPEHILVRDVSVNTAHPNS